MPVTYHFSRLAFIKNEIEPLEDGDHFTVVTPVGTFRMTKAEFYNVFSNVVRTTSYRIKGLYHYPTVPRIADRFLI